jgi:hypothetical protein
MNSKSFIQNRDIRTDLIIVSIMKFEDFSILGFNQKAGSPLPRSEATGGG